MNEEDKWRDLQYTLWEIQQHQTVLNDDDYDRYATGALDRELERIRSVSNDCQEEINEV